MRALVLTIIAALDIYKWILIISVVLSWLIAFNVINTYNRVVAQISDIFYRLTEPVLRPIRRFMPDLGGLDISPIAVLLLIFFLQTLLYDMLRGF